MIRIFTDGSYRPHRSLVDTGASVSLISADIYRKMNIPLQTETGQLQLYSVNGQSLNILGLIDTQIMINGRTAVVTFYVSDAIINKVILGCDSLLRHRAIVDIYNNIVKWPTLDTSSKLFTRYNAANIARVKDTVVIAPYARAIIPLKTELKPNINQTVLVESLNHMRGDVSSQVNDTCCFLKDGVVSCLIQNTTDRPYTLKENSAVAVVSNVSHVELCTDISYCTGNTSNVLQRVYTVSGQNDASENSGLKLSTKNDGQCSRRQQGFITLEEKVKYLTDFGFKIKRGPMSDQEYDEFCDLLIENTDVFQDSGLPIKSEPIKMPIREGANIRAPPTLRHTPAVKRALNEHIKELIDANVLEYGVTEVDFPLLAIKKPCSCKFKFRQKHRVKAEVELQPCKCTPELRYVCDLRFLNNALDTVRMQLPSIPDIVLEMAAAKERPVYFAKLDIERAFHKIELHQSSRRVLGVQTDLGQIRYKVLPQGSKISSAVFQKILTQCLKGLKGVCSYVDDIVCYSSSVSGLINILREVFDRCRKFRIPLKRSKFTSIDNKCIYLGIEFSEKGIRPSPERVQALQNLPTPSTPAQLRSILASLSFFRRFVRGFATKVAPFRSLLSPQTKFVWTPALTERYEDLKKALLSEDTLLIIPDFEQPFHCFVDSSKIAVGCVWCQWIDGMYKPVAFWSRYWKTNEIKLASTYYEILGLILSLENHPEYCNGRVIVWTDSISTMYIQQLKRLKGPSYRFYVKLMSYDLEFRRLEGKSHPADSFSRCIPDNAQHYNLLDEKELGIFDRVITAVHPESSDNKDERKCLTTTARNNVDNPVRCTISGNVWSQGQQSKAVNTPNSVYVIDESHPLHVTQMKQVYYDDVIFVNCVQAIFYFTSLKLGNFTQAYKILATPEGLRLRDLSVQNDKLKWLQALLIQLIKRYLVQYPALHKVLQETRSNDLVMVSTALSTDTDVEHKLYNLYCKALSVARDEMSEQNTSEVCGHTAVGLSAVRETANDGEHDEKVQPLSFAQRRIELLTSSFEQTLDAWQKRIGLENLKQLQKQCEDTKHFIDYKLHDRLPDNAQLAQRILYEAQHYEIGSNGLLYHWQRSTGQDRPCLVIPKVMRRELMEKLHRESLHSKFFKFYNMMKRFLYWKGMYADCQRYCENCLFCAERSQRKPDTSNLGHRGVFFFNQQIFIDHLYLGACKQSDDSVVYENVLTIVERSTNFVLTLPVRNLKTETTIERLYLYFAVAGKPSIILADKSSTFTSNRFSEFCRENDIELILHPAGRHQSNGSVEKVNSRILGKIRCLQQPRDWLQHITKINYMLNNEVSSATGFTALELMTGVEETPNINMPGLCPEKLELLDRWDNVHDSRLKALQKVQLNSERMDTQFAKLAKRLSTKQYTVGMSIFVYDDEVGAPRKLQKMYRPAVIKEVMLNKCYTVLMLDTRKTVVLHESRIKPAPVNWPLEEYGFQKQKTVTFKLPEDDGENKDQTLPGQQQSSDKTEVGVDDCQVTQTAVEARRRRSDGKWLFKVRFSNLTSAWLPAEKVLPKLRQKYYHDVKMRRREFRGRRK